MTLTIADKYYLKALDEYPWDLEQTMENLNYAFSYDDEHAGANCLMGKLYMEQFQQYEVSEQYFIDAMASDPCNLKTCESYVKLMIETNQVQKAKKLISYAKKLTGCEIGKFLWFEALLFEKVKEYDKAKEKIKEAMLEAFDSENIELMEAELDRVNKKLSMYKKVQYKLLD